MLRIQAMCTATRVDVTRVLFRPGSEGTNSARFGVRTATKCCDLKLCANRVRSSTQERESLRRQFSVRNLNFSPSTFTVYILHIFSQV